MKMNKVKEATDGARGWYLFGSEGYMLTGYQADPSGGVFLLLSLIHISRTDGVFPEEAILWRMRTENPQ